jgi:outer membrane biosynthesis protein TonB
MAPCKGFEESIAASVYDALQADEAEQLAHHLAGCAACSQELDELTRTAGLIETGDVRLTPDERDEVHQGIARRIDSTLRRTRKPIVVRRTWVVPAAAAAAILAAFVGLLIFANQRSPRPGDEEAVAVPRVIPPKVERLPEVAPSPPAPRPPAPEPIQPVPVPKAPEPEKKLVPVEPPAETPAPEKAPEPVPVPKERATISVMAHVEQVQGDVAVVTEAGRIAAKPGMELMPGQEILTGARSGYAVVKGTDGTRIDLSSDTALRIVSDLGSGSGRTFFVAKGVVAAAVAKQPPGQPMLFKSPNAEARVLGTRLVLDVAAESTRLEVREGKVRLTRIDDGAGVDVPAGSFAVASRGAAPAAHPDRASTGLLALYRFREGKGAILRDSSASGVPLDLKVLGMRAVTWTPEGLSLHGNTRIDSEVPAAKIVEACRKSNELTIEAWVKPAKATVDFEACILSLSTDVQDRNFALVQGENSVSKDLYSATLRLAETDGGGGPHLLTPKATSETKLTHLVFTRSAAGAEKLFVNGVVRATRTRSGTFATWNGAFRIILGNESFEERPWTGDYRLVAIYSHALTDAEVARNHKAGAE